MEVDVAGGDATAKIAVTVGVVATGRRHFVQRRLDLGGD